MPKGRQPDCKVHLSVSQIMLRDLLYFLNKGINIDLHISIVSSFLEVLFMIAIVMTQVHKFD